MQIRDWQEFYDSLIIEINPPEMEIWRPTVADLDAFESETGFKLPQSYREFILVFGPGTMAGSIQIAAPGYPVEESLFNLAYRNTWRESPSDWPEEHQDRIGRLFYFGLYSDEQGLGWDPEDVTDSAAPEYSVWEMRDDLTEHPRGRNFRVALEEMCEPLFANDNDPELAEIGPWRGFQPAPFPGFQY